MNVTQCNVGGQNKLNDNTLSERSCCGNTLNGLPVELLENIGSWLPYPDVCNLRLVCRHAYNSISNRIVKKSKENYYYEFPKMEKYNTKQKDLDFLNKALDSGIVPWLDHRFFSLNNEGRVTEHIGRPKYRNFFSRFEFQACNPISMKLSGSGFYIYTGKLANGLVFLKLPDQSMIKSFTSYSPEFNKILWHGSKHLTSGEDCHLSFYSFCVGESFDKVLETFKLTNSCTSLAGLVEDMLQNKKIYF